MNEDTQLIRRIITPDIIPSCEICGEPIYDYYCISQENYEKFNMVVHENCFKEIQHLYKIKFTTGYILDTNQKCICCHESLNFSKTYIFTYWRFDQDSYTQHYFCENCYQKLTGSRKEYIHSLAQKIKKPLPKSYAKERILFKLKF